MPNVEMTDAFSDFLHQYCGDASMDDFAAYSADDTAAAALHLWRLGLESGPDDRSVRVAKSLGADGRDMQRTLIEVIGPDRKFLVDSAIAACVESGVEVSAATHPTLQMDGRSVSFIQLHIEPVNDARLSALVKSLEDTFSDIDIATQDFQAMRTTMIEAADVVSQMPVVEGRDQAQIDEAADFLRWLSQDHFIFLGVREYRYARGETVGFIQEEPDVVDDSNLGILRDDNRNILSRGAEPAVLTPRIQSFLDEPDPIIVAKSNMRSRVHRRVYADYVGVKRHDENGEVIGEIRFVGLFTSDAYTRMARDVPLIRRKVETVKNMLEADAGDYSARSLNNVLETYPRDELFQISVDDLARIAQGVLALMQRPRTRLFIRRDKFDRYVSAILFTPRENYTPELRKRAHTAIAQAFGGRESAYYPQFSDGPLAHVLFIVGLNPGHPEPDPDALDIQIRQMAETWEDGLTRASRLDPDLEVNHSNVRFNAAYKEAFSPEEALKDLIAIEKMGEDQLLSVRTNGHGREAHIAGCKIYRRGISLDLSDMVPIMENMGLRVKSETGYPVTINASFDNKEVFWVHDVIMEPPNGGIELGKSFEDAFEAIWNGNSENDGFNELIVHQSMTWREAALLRTLSRYRQQTGMDPSETVQIGALVSHPHIACELVSLFAQRFSPAREGDLADRATQQDETVSGILKSLDEVQSLDNDRVLRRLMRLIMATQRSNFYQVDDTGRSYPYISIKVASQELEDLPAPKPFREIFVWSPDVEGVHLRFGPVARGGLRWSDRRDDFRTEVLGLVKAQQVKNSVIVPVGSKGGFYPKKLPVGGTREEVRDAGIAAYKIFISSLLQITDNLKDGLPQRPQNCIAWDGDDPYLVVAADKGTATFSDIANGLSEAHDFWLGDAFASGGSAGYDHKKMGITARGGWEAVKRHFREIGKDIQSEPFTCIGVGDMSGDVFGNGMLLSQQTKLLAAFNHLHVFVDPNPDPLVSWEERKRMFDLPRSTWADYNTDLISKGGGVFSRSAKSVNLTPEIKQMSGLTADSVTPDELIKALLLSNAELLWFGGIGTYVKASEETHASAGDKANDALRVNGAELSVKIIGEGANLGATQAGRIEFARNGGRVNTDAIDNSAGVDSSDHEVNIKILLSDAINSGDLANDARNDLLASMTDNVAKHVLRNNYDQTGALSIIEASAAADLDAHAQLMTMWEAEDKLNRHVEGLPSTDEINELKQQGLGLTRPELSVLMAYAKNDLFDAIVSGDAPDDPAFLPLLEGYFPEQLDTFEDARLRHRLKREIIATKLANRLVNLTGPIFPYQIRDAASVDVSTLVKAGEAAREVFGLDDLIARIDALDNKAPSQAQILMKQEMAGTVRHLTGSFLQPLLDGDPLADLITSYREGVETIRGELESALSTFVLDRIHVRADAFKAVGAPDDIADDVAHLRVLATAKETVDCAKHTGWPLGAVARIQHAIGERLCIDLLRAGARDIQLDDHWEQLALQRVSDAMPMQQAEMTIKAVKHAQKDGHKPESLSRETAMDAVDLWLAPQSLAADRVRRPIHSFEGGSDWSLAKLVLVSDALREFIQNSTETV